MNRTASILLYVRPWNKTQMQHLACGIFGAGATLHQTSEHASIDKSGLSAALTAIFGKIKPDASFRHLSAPETTDITLRCRLLRSFDPATARRLLLAAEQAISDVLDKARPDAMLSLTIDSYIMDVFATLCAQRGIRFIGIVPSFVKEHFRVTTRGEYVPCRTVSEAEIDKALANLTNQDYRPDFLVQSEHEMRRQMWRLWLRNFPKPLWFALKRMNPSERLNYHYWASQVVAQRYWSPWPQSLDGLSGPALARLQGEGGPPLVYLPLQMSPEATIDYWSHDTRWIAYEEFVLSLIRQYRKTRRFVVKEHPNLLGFRSRGFYKRLAKEPNCVIASPKVASNDLVELCDGVVVCTGSAGFEAALRGKPVYSDSNPYYLPLGALRPLAALQDDLPKAAITPEQQRAMVAFMLGGTLPGRFLNNGRWSVESEEHRVWSARMAQSIRSILDRDHAATADTPFSRMSSQ
ncbi:hypothetical protein [Sulfitobacter sp. 1A12779]|uniref:capsular polysaccharide export protein, LipB/KpsS family n=1 Tax=Sulfitobacter sp. 1A12779 TaxID=3368599 RepID=UPI003744F97C